jgi:hypothetical protein
VFVSVSGNDANTCSNIATPCRTFAGGITQVDAQGEVIVIASGSYAGGAITKSVKINVASGVVAFSGLPITVDPGAGGTVVLRGLTLKAATAGSGTGITHQSGVLFVENTVVDGWLEGLVSNPGAEQLFVKGSVFRNQLNNGLWVQATSTAGVAVDDSFFEHNGTGLWFQAGRGRVTSTVMTGNGYGAITENAGTDVTYQLCEISGNSNSGLYAYLSIARVSASTITRNGYGLRNYASMATLESFGTNVIRGNITDTDGTITPVALQ